MTYCYCCTEKAQHMIHIGRYVPVCDEHEEEAQMEEGPLLFSCDIDEWGGYAPPAPAVEYQIVTTTDRILSRSAVDMTQLLNDLVREKHTPKHIQLWSEWEAAEKEIEAKDKQLEWNWKAEREIEGEKTA